VQKIEGMKAFKFLLLFLIPLVGWSQDLEEVQPGRFDQGKMWTFENPPIEYFKEAYGFDANDEWLEDVRKSSLRFASWCSASFISENGLIMTNHHCSRGVVASVMEEGENFDDNGFYATTLEGERRIPDLYVDQLVKIEDVTEQVKGMTDVSPSEALEKIQAEFQQSEEWNDLVIETRTFYSGGKYSLYGFKRYTDIRLVLYPELALGYFGGDPDNFTYPRYNLDFTFFRAYDENGQPLTPSNYFEFNPGGPVEDEAVFVVGNPGSTGRYLTMSQLYYQRDVAIPALLSYITNRVDILMKAAEGIEDVYEKDSVTNLAFSLSNAVKAYTGRLEGMKDPYLMTKKEKKEQQVRSNVTLEGSDPWDEIEKNMTELREVYPDLLLLSPNGLKGKINQVVHQLDDYQEALEAEDEKKIADTRENIEEILDGFDPNLERALFASQLGELQEHSRGGYMTSLLSGQAPYDKASAVLENSTLLTDPDKFFKMKPKKLSNEPLIEFAQVIPGKYAEVGAIVGQLNQKNEDLQERIMNLQFELSGVSSPPDATFSLRIADGAVKGYDYNGTTAPVFTTYFGLYDRHYSNNQEYPWNLPEKWMNPSLDLLKAPLNFVCTADIIGGNSGSPVINTKGEAVGLVFDGNIESLPGYFQQ
jgi:hypothetical protein